MSKRSLNAEDPNKKQRPAAAAEEPVDAAHMDKLEQLSLLQDEIEKLNAEADEEKLKIDRKYAEKKKPHLRRRNDISMNISGFWLSCFRGHSVVSKVLDDEDAEILAHLTDLWVDETETSFKITFKFGKGASAWFDGDTLWKEFKAEPSGQVLASASPIRWKSGKNLIEKALSKPDGMTFFQWFTETDADDELAQLIRDEIFADPLMFYDREPDDDDDDEEGEGEEEAEEADK